MFGLDLGNLVVHLNMDVSQWERQLNTVERQAKNIGKKMEKIGRKLTTHVTLPLLAVGAGAVKAFANFDDAMTKSLAIMGDVSDEMRDLMEVEAITISNESITSATDLAESYFFLASAGLDAEQSIGALSKVEQFAVAGAFNMATATDLLTDAQSALGLSVDDAVKNTENLVRVSDVLVGANTLANATVEQFSSALTAEAGPAMKAYNISLEDGVSVLAAYADQGIKAQMAGNMFGRMLRLSVKAQMDNVKVWKDMNVELYNLEGNFLPMHQVIRNISNVLEGMSVKQKAATLSMLGFEARSQQTLLPILGLQDAIQEYSEQLENMGGITSRVAEKQLTSFTSEMKIFWNQVVNAGRAIGEILAPKISAITGVIIKVVKQWNKLSDSTKALIVNVGLVVATLGPLLLIGGKLFMLFGFIAGKMALMTAQGKILTMVMSRLGMVIGAAIIGWQIGKWASEEFEIVQQVGNVMVASLWKGWEYVKYGFKQMAAGIKLVWIGLKKSILIGIGTIITKIGLGLAKLEAAMNRIPKVDVSIGGEALQQWGVNMLKSAGDLETAKDLFAKNTADLDKNIKKVNTTLTAMMVTTHQKFLDKNKVPEVIKGIGDAAGDAAIDIDALQAAMDNMGIPELGGAKQISEVEQMINALKKEYDMLGLISEERERAESMARFEATALNTLTEGTEEYNEALKEYSHWLNKVAEGQRGPTAMMVELKTWASDATNIWQNMGDIMVGAFDRTADALNNLLHDGTADFAELADSITREITKMAIKIAMAKAMMAAIGGAGGGGGSLLSFHKGGTVPFDGVPRFHNGLNEDEFPAVLQTGEMVLSKDTVKSLQTADRESSSDGGGGGGGGTVNITVQSIDSQDTMRFLEQNKRTIASMLQSAVRENHPFRRSSR